MIITRLFLENVRNLASDTIYFDSNCNVFVGKNGSGKTSVLESLYLALNGSSFRTNIATPVVQYGSKRGTVFVDISDGTSIAVQKSLFEPTVARVNKKNCRSRSELISLLPSLLLYQDVFNIIDAGSAVRRKLMDWGVFHVKHSFFSVWKDYQNVLKHRNALLKRSASDKEIEPWSRQLSDFANSIHALRESYFHRWVECFYEILANLTNINCKIEYYKGWDKKQKNQDLLTILDEHKHAERQRQYTLYGSHQADLIIHADHYNAKQQMSRGQQKIVLIALKISQVALLDRPCVFFIDDLFAELDDYHIRKIQDFFSKNHHQYFFSCTDEKYLQYFDMFDSKKIFNIDEGKILS